MDTRVHNETCLRAQKDITAVASVIDMSTRDSEVSVQSAQYIILYQQRQEPPTPSNQAWRDSSQTIYGLNRLVWVNERDHIIFTLHDQ